MRKCCSITRMRSILYFASDEETVLTQQEICNACFLPKQTVNTAIAGLAQKGLAELELIPGTRNKKRILLTDAGRELEKNTTDRLRGAVYLNRSPSSRQLKKYKFFLPVEIYLLAVFMQLASKFHVFPLALKFQDSFASVYCCSNLYNLRSFLREYLYQ